MTVYNLGRHEKIARTLANFYRFRDLRNYGYLGAEPEKQEEMLTDFLKSHNLSVHVVNDEEARDVLWQKFMGMPLGSLKAILHYELNPNERKRVKEPKSEALQDRYLEGSKQLSLFPG